MKLVFAWFWAVAWHRNRRRWVHFHWCWSSQSLRDRQRRRTAIQHNWYSWFSCRAASHGGPGMANWKNKTKKNRHGKHLWVDAQYISSSCISKHQRAHLLLGRDFICILVTLSLLCETKIQISVKARDDAELMRRLRRLSTMFNPFAVFNFGRICHVWQKSCRPT